MLSKLCLSKAQNYDWEAIATAPCDSKGKVYKESQMGAKTFTTTSLEYTIFFWKYFASKSGRKKATDLASLIGNTQCGNFRIFCHSDFTWNQFWSFWSPKNCHFNHFSKYEFLFFGKNQNSKHTVYDLNISAKSDFT